MTRAPQQAAAIPFRRQGPDTSICLITSMSSGSWGIPKGTIERGSSPEETALQETLEEAGLEGTIVGEIVGTYVYEKYGALLTVAVFLMEVRLELEDWEERDARHRRWVPARDAAHVLGSHPARSLVEEACRRLGA